MPRLRIRLKVTEDGVSVHVNRGGIDEKVGSFIALGREPGAFYLRNESGDLSCFVDRGSGYSKAVYGELVPTSALYRLGYGYNEVDVELVRNRKCPNLT